MQAGSTMFPCRLVQPCRLILSCLESSARNKVSSAVIYFPLPREATDASQEVTIKFINEIFRIETRESSEQNGQCDGEEGEGEARMKKPDCNWCKDNPRRKCKHCACSVCGGKDSPEKQILCDECDMAYHLWCLTPPLEGVPESDEW